MSPNRIVGSPIRIVGSPIRMVGTPRAPIGTTWAPLGTPLGTSCTPWSCTLLPGGLSSAARLPVGLTILKTRYGIPLRGHPAGYRGFGARLFSNWVPWKWQIRKGTLVYCPELTLSDRVPGHTAASRVNLTCSEFGNSANYAHSGCPVMDLLVGIYTPCKISQSIG